MIFSTEWLPDDVKKMGERWIYGKLSRKEIEEIRKKFITEHIIDRWCWRSKQQNHNIIEGGRR